MHRCRLSRRPCRFGRRVPRPPLAQHLAGTLPMPRYRFCCPLEPWAGMHRPPTGPRCATSGIWAGHLSRRRQQPFADDGRPSPTRPRSGTANGVSRQGAERSSRTCVRRSGPASPRGNRAIANGNAAQHANGQAPCRPGAGLRGRVEGAEQAACAGTPATAPAGMAERSGDGRSLSTGALPSARSALRLAGQDGPPTGFQKQTHRRRQAKGGAREKRLT